MDEVKRFKELGVTDYVSVSSNIFKGKAIIESVMVMGDAGLAECSIYDGEDTNGKQKASMVALSGTMENWQPGRGCGIDRGIYISMNAATTKVSITYTDVGD